MTTSVTVTGVGTGKDNDPVSGRSNCCAVIGRDIQSGVHLSSATAKWVTS
jgi:hypothetical protein